MNSNQTEDKMENEIRIDRFSEILDAADELSDDMKDDLKTNMDHFLDGMELVTWKWNDKQTTLYVVASLDGVYDIVGFCDYVGWDCKIDYRGSNIHDIIRQLMTYIK